MVAINTRIPRDRLFPLHNTEALTAPEETQRNLQDYSNTNTPLFMSSRPERETQNILREYTREVTQRNKIKL